MVQVTIRLPDAVADAFGKTAETRQRTVLEDTAIEAYREGRLTQRQVGDVVGLDYWQTEDLLLKRGVPLNYGIVELDEDRATMEKVIHSIRARPS
ncbi:MAG TPA: UPF0175 family protein [Verrucomicrobiae bacterium]|nr:UPF0175 family protein [Verrucomicrobiae bacterium]